MEENQLSVSNERLFAGDFSDRLSSSQLLFSSPEESPVNMTLTKERSKAGRNPLHTRTLPQVGVRQTCFRS